MVFHFQISFFFSKKDFKCHSCKPATDKQTKRDRKLRNAILELVELFSSCISSSLYGLQKVKNNNTLVKKTRVLTYPTRNQTTILANLLPIAEIEHLFVDRVYDLLQLLQLEFHHLPPFIRIVIPSWMSFL